MNTDHQKLEDIWAGALGVKKLPRLSRWQRLKNKVRYRVRRTRDFARGYCIPTDELEPSRVGLFVYMMRICPWCDIGMNEGTGRAAFNIKLYWHYRYTPWRRRAAEGVLRGFLEGARAVGVVYTVTFTTQPLRRPKDMPSGNPKPVDPWSIN